MAMDRINKDLGTRVAMPMKEIIVINNFVQVKFHFNIVGALFNFSINHFLTIKLVQFVTSSKNFLMEAQIYFSKRFYLIFLLLALQFLFISPL